MSLLTYYCLIIVVFVTFILKQISLIIYDLLFYVTYKSDVCPEIVAEPADGTGARQQSIYIFNNGAEQDETTDEAAADETAADETAADEAAADESTSGSTTNNLVLMPLFIIILYGGISVLCLLAMLGIYCFSGMSSERFGNLNWFWGCCGLYVRNFEFLTRILSIVGLLFIGVQAALTYFGESCKEAVHEYTVNRKIYQEEGAMYNASIMLVIVNLGFWGATHCIIPLLKLIMDSEAFLYEPYDRTKSTAYYICCGVFGP